MCAVLAHKKAAGAWMEQKAISVDAEIEALTDPNFMTSFARGLAVIQAFSDQRRSLTIAQISHRTGISRAAVRRCLFTLQKLGYAEADGTHFSLKPKVLTLGYSYLSSTPLTVSTPPYLNAVSRELNESCSMAVLAGTEVLYVARSATSRIMSVSLNTGSRLPAYCTSLGRVMLANLDPGQLDDYFGAVKLSAYTHLTLVSEARLREVLHTVREDGYAIVDQELEIGLRSIAVPVRGAQGSVVAALNVGVQSSRVSSRRMRDEFLPVLAGAARELSVLLP
jgi:IclR family pca regulon transcriptional regulator